VTVPTTQRWRLTRAYYRERAADFRPGDFGVEVIPDDTTARAFVVAHHYAASYPAARLRVGLYRRTRAFVPELVGVAVFSVGVQPRAVPAWAPGLAPSEGVDLGRFVLLDEVPYNGETFFLARCFPILREALPDVRVVLSYSDPMPRKDAEGRVVMPGHVGAIYAGKGARYVGRTRGEYIHLGPDGRVWSRRGLHKLVTGDRGARGRLRALFDLGVPMRSPYEDVEVWLDRVLAGPLFRRVKHPGNHVFLFSPRGVGEDVPSSRVALPYPRKDAA
jgi:hypothetical protein